LILRGVSATRRERNRYSMAAVLGRFLDGRAPSKDDEIRERDLLAVGRGRVEVLLDLLEGPEHLVELGRLVDLPVLLGLEADARAVRPAPLVGASEGSRRPPRDRYELGDGQPGSEDRGLEGFDVLTVDERMLHRGNRVLPDERLGRDLGTEVTGARPHV